MKIPTIDTNVLIEELQLGDQLGQCVHSNRRADFALMLSMLTDDVRAHSQFKLPQTTSEPPKSNEDTLRKYFDLPPKERLSLTQSSDIDEFSQSSLIQQQQLTSVRLNQALTPKPLSFRDDKDFVESTVMSNTSLYCQQQHNKNTRSKSFEHLSFNVNEWLKSVQLSIVKAPLLDAIA